MAPPRAKRRAAADPQAKYDAAGTGRRMGSWKPGSAGPQKVIEGLQRIRDRARDASRNDWTGESATQKWTTNLIGVGIRPRFKRIPEGARRQAIVDLWEDWTRVADADGVLDFYGLQTLGVRSWLESGEVFLRLRPRQADAPLPVPFQVQLVEADFVPMFDADTHLRLPEGNKIRQGIEINRYGRRIAYWMHREHPGDSKAAIEPNSLIRVPAAQVRHIFCPKRPGQMRGVSDLAPVLARLRDAGDMEDAVLLRQKLGNLIVSIITKQIPEDWDGEVDPQTGLPVYYNEEGRAMTSAEPGAQLELLPGEDHKFSNPPEAGISHSDYMRTVHMGTAAASGLPYEVFSGDIRGVSDRAMRVVILEFRRYVAQRQWQVIIPMLCQPCVEGFVEAAALVGKLRLSELDSAKRVEWAPEGWEHIHPVQDPQGKILEMQAGLRSRSSIIGERGDDRGDVDRERKDDEASAARYGLTPPADPAAKPVPPKGQPVNGVDMGLVNALVALATAAQRAGPEAEGRLVDTLKAMQPQASAPPSFTVHNHVAPAAVALTVEPAAVHLPAPTVEVTVQPPEVHVAAPVLQVTNNVPAAEITVNLPDRHTTSEIERDAAGQIINVTQTETTLLQ